MNDFIHDFEVLVATFPTELYALNSIGFDEKSVLGKWNKKETLGDQILA